MKKERIKTNFSLDKDLLKKIKHLAVEEEVNYNELIEEGMARVLKARSRKKTPREGQGNAG